MAEKSYKQYDYVSRYESFPYYYDEESNRYYYGLTSYVSNDTSYTEYKVKPGDSYDSIAANLYGWALYYWVICDYNRILDCLIPPTPGTVLRIPKLNAISYVEG